MKKDKPSLSHLNKMRQQAEKVFGMRLENLQKLSVEEIYRLIHEVEVYLVELEKQNKDLSRFRQEPKKRSKELAENMKVAENTTRFKQIEKDLNQYHNHLEELVIERTSQLNLTAEALRESEAKYAIVIEQAMDAIAVIQDKSYKFVNKAMTELSGYSSEELMAQSPCSIATSEYRELCLQRQYIPDEDIHSYEIKIKDKYGKIKNVLVSAKRIQYEGKPAILRFMRDVTESKKLEEELQKIERLKSIGTLAGGLAHDFRNILTAIVGNISLAKLYLKAENKAFDLLTEAEKASSQAKDLTQQLLTFSKGGAPVKKTSSIRELLKDTAEFALKGSGVKCEFFLPDDLWSAEIDQGQIGQVLNNLIMNADQAMPKGGTIRLSAENMVIGLEDSLPLKSGHYIKISIEDHGIGIPHENLPKIFDPYFTTKSTGSGLGLTTAYSIIKKHDGLLTVESQPKVGTTSSFYLPASQQLIEPSKHKNLEGKYLPHGQGRILLMDDEAMVRNITGRMLEHLGYVVEFAQNGSEAIELYKKRLKSGRPFDVVIMDLIIPGAMGGKEAIGKLHEVAPDAKAIVSSGYSNDPILSEYKHYGFTGAITKPYDVKKLKETIQRIIGDPPDKKKPNKS